MTFAPLAIQFHVQVFTGDTVNIQMEELVLLEKPSTLFSLDSTDEHLQNSLVYRASSISRSLTGSWGWAAGKATCVWLNFQWVREIGLLLDGLKTPLLGSGERGCKGSTHLPLLLSLSPLVSLVGFSVNDLPINFVQLDWFTACTCGSTTKTPLPWCYCCPEKYLPSNRTSSNNSYSFTISATAFSVHFHPNQYLRDNFVICTWVCLCDNL